jgi:DNA-3-methyladenine glycosylase I
MTHCLWAPLDDPLYRHYHDSEWGVPDRDPVKLFAKLQLDGMQAGLSWITILRKRETILAEFEGFDPDRLALWDQDRIDKALTNPGIIRSPTKIAASVNNARLYLAMRDEEGLDFSDWLWAFQGGKPVINHWENYKAAPPRSELSETIAKALKQRGFKFCGPVIVYAFMQAVGMINDHEIGCPRWADVQKV